MLRCSLIALSAISLAACPAAVPESQPVDRDAERAVVEAAVDTWFNSSIAGLDTAAISAGVTPTFFIFEDTLRLDRAGFVGYVAQQIASMPGPFTLRYALSEWDTRIEGDVAWTSFRNRGVLTPSQGDPTNFEWLETAILMRVDGRWLIERYHSAPVRRSAP